MVTVTSWKNCKIGPSSALIAIVGNDLEATLYCVRSSFSEFHLNMMDSFVALHILPALAVTPASVFVTIKEGIIKDFYSLGQFVIMGPGPPVGVVGSYSSHTTSRNSNTVSLKAHITSRPMEL